MARRPASTPVDGEAWRLAETKLAGSGISMAEAEALGIEVLGPAQAQRLGTWVKPLPALLLAYLDPAGQPLQAWPGHPPFFRLRYLKDEVDSSGFSAQTKRKPLRYVQPPNTSVAAYLPRVPDIDWLEVLADPEQPLIITEGELKAACACLRGFPTLGIGGVTAWRALGKGVEFLPELEATAWVGRHVYLCFDSDYRSNELVLDALQQLGDALVRRGAYVYLVSIPQVDKTKVGLDDFLVSESDEAFAALLKAAEPVGLTRPLFDLNKQYLYVRYPGLMYDRTSGERMTTTAFADHVEAPRLYQERSLRSDGSISHKAVGAAAAWLRWPLRTEVARLLYQPGTIGMTHDENGAPAWSLWRGWGAEPAAKATNRDVQPFLDLVDHLFTGADPRAKEWFLRWCAYPLKYPGVKLFSCVLIWGRRHGTGKSLLGYTLGKIYGRNFTVVKKRDLHGSFNSWAENRQFALGEEITGSDKLEDADLLKALITQEKVTINIKFLPSYDLMDCLNWYFTSNHPDAFFLEDDDRRSFIHEVTVGALDEAFYVDYDLWLNTDGPAKLHRWLLDLDLGDFNPSAPAYRTAAKERMIADTQSDLGAWVRQLRGDPDQVLKFGEVPIRKDLFTNKELLAFYDPEGRTRVTANGLGRELKRAGIEQVLEGRPIKMPDGPADRLYAVRNSSRWLSATAEDVQAHLQGWRERQVKASAKRY